MSTWTPRPPAVDEPACWSWPVPPLLDRDTELARLVAATEAANALVDPTERRDSQAFAFHLHDMGAYRFEQFHAGRCAICEADFSGSHRRQQVVDHDHDSGQARGLLCKSCNSSEGRGDSPLLQRYRAWHPAAILDHHAMYSGIGWTDGWSWRLEGTRATTAGIRPPTPWPAWNPATTSKETPA